jgi:F-type H+-transporting ATPase subunit delta
MAEKATIARPYAKAAFAHARASGSLSAWSGVLAAASAAVTDSRVARLLGNPKVTPADLATLVLDVSGAGTDAGLRNYITTLAANRRLALLPEIAAMFEVMRAEIENVADVQVVSAVELTDAQRQRLSGALKKRLHRDVRLHCSVDASLIGGAIIRSQDLVIDGSLSARLKRLTTELTN